MAVNLLASLCDRDAAAELFAGAQRAAEARGYRLLRITPAAERLFAWIDWTFAPSWWSDETRARDGWYAATASGEIAGFAGFGERSFPYPWLGAYRERRDVAIFGPYGVGPAHRGSGVGAALLDASLASMAAFAQSALIPAVTGERLIAMYAARTGAQIVETFRYPMPRARAALLASGSGTNVQAVIDAVRAERIALDLHVIANDATAHVRERARRAGVPETAIVWNRGAETRAAYDARVIAAVDALVPDLVLLLGWMHLLPAAFVERFHDTYNVHPAFLPFDPDAEDVVMPDGSRIPAFRGARSPEATIAAGAAWSGVSVHRVTAAADRGAIAVRTPHALAPGTTLDDLRAQLRPLEHAAVEKAVRRWGFER